MKQRLKKILSAMIVACMMVSLLPTALALDISGEETGSCGYGEIGAVKVYDGGTVEVGSTWNTFILTAPSAEYMAEKQPGKTFVCWVDGSGLGNEKVYVPDTLYWHLNTGAVLRLYAKYSDDNSDQYYLVNYHNPDGTLYDTELGVVGETVELSTDFPTTAEAQWYTDAECTIEASDIAGESGATYCLYSKEKMYRIVTGNWSNNAEISLVTPSEPQTAAGTQVNFTVEPSEGFQVDSSAVSVLYVDEEGNDCSVVVTQNTDGSYSFTMPAANVGITAVAVQTTGTYCVDGYTLTVKGNYGMPTVKHVNIPFTLIHWYDSFKMVAPSTAEEDQFLFWKVTDGIVTDITGTWGIGNVEAGTAYRLQSDVTIEPVYYDASLNYLVKYLNPDGSLYNVELGTANVKMPVSEKTPTGTTGYWYEAVNAQFPKIGTVNAGAGETVTLYSKAASYHICRANPEVVDTDGNKVGAFIDLAVNGESTECNEIWGYTAQAGDEVTVTVNVPDGYVLDSVIADNVTLYKTGESGEVYAFTMPAEKVTGIQAVLKNVTRNIYTEYDGTALIESNSTAKIGETVTFIVTPANGYTMDAADITVTYPDADGVTVYVTVNPATEADKYSFVMPDADVTITANAKPIPDCTVTYLDSEGNELAEQPETDNKVGDIITLMEEYEETGKTLIGWQINGLVYAPGFDNFVLTGDTTIKAVMTTNKYVVLFVDEDDGCLLAGSGGYKYGSEASATAPTVSGKQFAGWTNADGEVVSTEAAFTTTVTADEVYYATYELEEYTVTASADKDRGSVTVDPETANVGDKITVTADPDDGYRVKEVKAVDADGNSVPVSFVQEDANYVETWSFTMPANDVEVTVYFELQGSSYYTDVRTDAWYYHSVTFVSDRGYFKGVTPTLFGPEIPMDRGMFVTVLGRVSDVDTDEYTETSFDDVDTDEYYAPYVAWAQENGIVNGTSESTFEPKTAITREQMTTIMYRYCEYLELDMSNPNPQFMDRYTDTDEISAYAQSSVEWAVGVGLIKGVAETSIDPQGTATRAQVAQVIMNLSDKVLYQ